MAVGNGDQHIFVSAPHRLRHQAAHLVGIRYIQHQQVHADQNPRRFPVFQNGHIGLKGIQLHAHGPLRRRIALCRELTKLHEETRRCTLAEAVAYYTENAPKGEFVLVVAGAEPRQAAAVTLEDAVAQVLALKEQGIRLKDAAKEVSEHTGISKNELYAAALEH